MDDLKQAERTAQVLSQQKYQGYSRWFVEATSSKTFEDGKEIASIQSARILATEGGLVLLKLSLEEALLALTELEDHV